MSDTPSFRLEKAPIIEAVFEFYCDLPPGLDRKVFEAASKKAFEPEYPLFHTNYLQEYKFDAKPNQAPHGSMQQVVHGFRHSTADKKQLIQTRFDGFFFNRLSPYAALEDYLPEIQRCWMLYCAFAQPVVVKKIGLRYINRIVLPLTEGKLNFKDYIRNGPQLPPNTNYALSFTGFMHQHQMVEVSTGNMATVVLAAQPLETTGLPVILDIAVSKPQQFRPDAWQDFANAIQELRNLKNYLFRETLTEKCLTLF